MPDVRHSMIEVFPPDIRALRAGNRGVEYVTTLESGRSGPHVVINALTHGNEFCGAIAIERLMAAGISPRRGKLTLAMANVAAFGAFNENDPYATRYIDEDFNRLWTDRILVSDRHSVELDRARALEPIYADADILLDLHSMSVGSLPMALCGRTTRSRELVLRMGFPRWVVADSGHRAGPRLIDYGAFAEPEGDRTAILVECGQHWRADSCAAAFETCLRLLDVQKMLPDRFRQFIPLRRDAAQVVEVTDVVTSETGFVTFTENYLGLEVVMHAGTIVGYDGRRPIATPYDNCVLVMPTRHAHPGQTAVRLGRLVAA